MINDADERESSESPASRPTDAWPYGALRDGGDPRRPFSVLRYWLPGSVLAVVVGVASLATAAVVGGFGWATLGIPLALGAFCGYGLPGSKAFPAAVVATVAFVATASLFPFVGPAGFFCAVILGAIGAPIAFVGALLGWGLRLRMQRSRYYWARFLPLLLAAALAGPGAALESWLSSRNEVVDITTTAIVDASPEQLWTASLFADSHAAAPSPLTHVGLAAPRHNEGSLRSIGDLKTVPLGDGVVRLRVTRCEAPRLLDYEVVEQSHFEDRTARLVGGSMRLTRRDDGCTDVSLTTRYEPLLGARAVWGPIERFVAEQLHAHVLREVERVAATHRVAPAPPSEALDQ